MVAVAVVIVPMAALVVVVVLANPVVQAMLQ
jgi:hypothetical protein